MLVFNGVQITPCIASKARHALRLKAVLPRNEKKCSLEYWEIAVRAVANLYRDRLDEEDIFIATSRYSEYF